MFVNDLVKTYGYTRDKLAHFNISIFNAANDDWMTIDHPTVDEYIYLCDRPVVDWLAEEDNQINITIYAIPQDYEIFRKYLH